MFWFCSQLNAITILIGAHLITHLQKCQRFPIKHFTFIAFTGKIVFIRHEYRGSRARLRQYHVIDAEVTYRLTQIPTLLP